jgi:hypothetical protein
VGRGGLEWSDVEVGERVGTVVAGRYRWRRWCSSRVVSMVELRSCTRIRLPNIPHARPSSRGTARPHNACAIQARPHPGRLDATHLPSGSASIRAVSSSLDGLLRSAADTSVATVARNSFEREQFCADPGVIPGVTAGTIGHMVAAALPNHTKLATSGSHSTHGTWERPTVVLSAPRPTLSRAAARALLRIVLDANSQNARASSRGSPSGDTHEGSLRI